MTDPSREEQATNPLQPEAAEAAERFRYVYSPELPDLLASLQVTVVATTYQAGRVLAFSSREGRCSLLMRAFEHPMGIAIADDQLALMCKNQIWFMRNQTDLISADGTRPDYDAYFVPRHAHVTGDIAGHEIAWGVGSADAEEERPSAKLWIINTRFSCIATLVPEYSFLPFWQPPFITALEAGDRCHLNGLALEHGRPRYVTAFAESDTPQGWREARESGGIIIDVPSGEIVTRGLAMPHSPRLWDNQLWVLNSGQATLEQVNRQSGARTTVVKLPGFTRGLAFHDHYAFIGLSKAREKRTFGDLPLAEQVTTMESAIYVVDLNSGGVVGFMRFENTCDELFDVQIVPRTTSFNLLGFAKDTVDGIFILPPLREERP